MRSTAFRPPSRPPVSAGDLARYADKWVVVRSGKVVLQAATFDELAALRSTRRFKDGDRILHLPPVAVPAKPPEV